MRTVDQATFIRNFSVMNNGDIDFFLGSGASAQAGIPTGGSMVWEFKRELYCTQTETSKERFKDLQANISRQTLQSYFDDQGDHPALQSADEYAHYFELCYPTAIARERYIQNKVRDIAPSLGHLCLADLFINKKISNVWTSNFDELIEAGIKTLSPHHSFNVYSSVNKTAAPANALSSILKLHGDYRYDRIKNIPEELQSLETSMQNSFEKQLFNRGLVVIGYSGSDESIMSVLEKNISNSAFLKYGLIWAKPTGTTLSHRTEKLMEQACSINESSCIIEISGFDEMLYSIYKSQGRTNERIDNHWRDYIHRKLPITFTENPIQEFIKLNTFESELYPDCMVFDTDIKSWKELRTVIGDSGMIAALYSRRIYCFDDESSIRAVFGSHILSSITCERIENRILYRNNSIYLGMLYQLIQKTLTVKYNLIEFRRNKYYNPNISCILKNTKAFEAIEVSLSVYHGKIYLSILPTVCVFASNGREIDRFEKQRLINQAMSTIYNAQYDEKLRSWNKRFSDNGKMSISFEYKNFVLSFGKVYVSSGGSNRNPKWPQKEAFHFSEPEMVFDVQNPAQKSVNQLKGITKYGPIDYSYSKDKSIRPAIKLAIISPKGHLQKILNHLGALNRTCSPQKSNDGFLIPYNEFEAIYRRSLQIPAINDTSYIIAYNENSVRAMNEHDFVSMMKRFIDQLATNHGFDVAVVYIPMSFAKYRESSKPASDFNLHDALKLYATDKGVKLQFVEERSTKFSDQCKVLWGLSTSIYAKASGVLWQPITLSNDTAFVGVSYALSRNKGTCIGCSQLFDSTGTGIRLLLRKIKDPSFYEKNPYMKCDEAYEMMSALRDKYYQWNPTNRLKRIVVHKTTPFTQDEVKGFTQALEGIDDIELLQIQEFASWRAIRFGSDFTKGAANFAIHRGTVIPLNDDSFLVWTHGCIQHDELLGSRLNYYKGGRGIPAPLLVKRFYGKASGDILAKEIFMLSKMNWNSGDSLYKQLPVTLDFAKTLSRMSKQDEAIYNNAYDFRFFM